MTGPEPGSSTGRSWAANGLVDTRRSGKDQPSTCTRRPSRPATPADLPDAAPPEQSKPWHRIGEAGEDLHVVVPAHREHGDPGRREPVHPAAEIPVRLVKIVLLLDYVAREQYRVDLVSKGEVDGDPPRRGRPELARLELVQEPRGKARGLPAEMDITNAEKLHDFSRAWAGPGPGEAAPRTGK